ncbi:porin family protein [Nonlabens agnitus]|uniref:Outer membrane protein beta-barrel domain-containing protein n=1 Tax=Nonlabens agnitus TaxID=870484 RepID=A0A2S9WTG1_9FLAO|nr:porin family protein [Nonlabens agnitus]PRP66783.1 hypothetical protein BST86_06555 [Nonlabens agnitus]
MKKSLIALSFALASFCVSAQQFGVKGGYNNLNIKASASGVSSESEDGSGFYVGFFTDIALGNSFSIQPELQFSLASQDGEDVKNLLLPIMLSYQVAPKFSLQAGPQIEYYLEEENPIINEFGLGLGAGAAFDITDKLFVDGRYILGLSNRFEDDVIVEGSDGKLKFDYIQVGLGYKF